MFSLSRLFLGAPKAVKDPAQFHKMSLIALLAWVGLGADGLSSSSYGPAEAFGALFEAKERLGLPFAPVGMAILLAIATAATVFIISYGYSRIIERFPTGGGGYVVASRLLGPRVGVVSGSALLVDYVLTITISLASGADALYSLFPPSWHGTKFAFTVAGLIVLTILNLRGVKESVTALVPIFILFLLTHALLLGTVFVRSAANALPMSVEVMHNIARTQAHLGTFAFLQLFMRAYSLGGGTYTGIEAVSNGLGMMREPRVRTGKRTMALMATSLAVTAGGLLLCYLLVQATPVAGKTLNAVLAERVAGNLSVLGVPLGHIFVILTLVSEGALLFVAAQAGFLDGPRVMASMASDGWLPRRFVALSERLTMQNGVLLMTVAAVAALLYTRGDVSRLVVMYSINVFLTFSLSNLAMLRFWTSHRREHAKWWRHLPAHGVALVLCASILVVTILEKFAEGGWVTLLVTAALVLACFGVKRHYERVALAVRSLDDELPSPAEVEAGREAFVQAATSFVPAEDDPSLLMHPARCPFSERAPIAVLFVGGYGALARHALMRLLRMFPNHFGGVVFAAVAAVDTDSFRTPAEVESLEQRVREGLTQCEQFAAYLGLPAMSYFGVGTDVAHEAERIAEHALRRFPRGLFVAGQLVFTDEAGVSRLLHNETAFRIQDRVQRRGAAMVVVPMTLRLHPPEPRGFPLAARV
jgi:amino acid transporter